jgi:hypothetical protein
MDWLCTVSGALPRAGSATPVGPDRIAYFNTNRIHATYLRRLVSENNPASLQNVLYRTITDVRDTTSTLDRFVLMLSRLDDRIRLYAPKL